MTTRRVMRLPVHQTSLIMGLVMGCMGLIIVLLATPFMMIGMSAMKSMAPSSDMPSPFPFGGGIAILLIAPLMYSVMGYISTAIFAFIFNLIAPRVGGLAVEIAD